MDTKIGSKKMWSHRKLKNIFAEFQDVQHLENGKIKLLICWWVRTTFGAYRSLEVLQEIEIQTAELYLWRPVEV